MKNNVGNRQIRVYKLRVNRPKGFELYIVMRMYIESTSKKTMWPTTGFNADLKMSTTKYLFKQITSLKKKNENNFCRDANFAVNFF